MKKFIVKFFLLLVWFVLLVSCSGQEPIDPNQESEFLHFVPQSDVNTIIKMSSKKIGSDLVIGIVNESNEPVAFPPGIGIKIFSYDKKLRKWAEIKNEFEYMNTDLLILVPQSTSAENSHQILPIDPELGKEDLPLTIRVLVTGNLFKNNEMTNEQVSAYTDIRLDESYIP